ncbi:MAG: hypothetical protein KJ069_28745 [Anaerolineae bacterium]|nr:hypothetical protein [Anaerolineae bacterium]
MNDVTLDKALDAVMELPLEQQELLVDIIRNRHVERRRQEIARDAQESLLAYRQGQLRPQPLAEIIRELRQELHEDAA